MVLHLQFHVVADVIVFSKFMLCFYPSDQDSFVTVEKLMDNKTIDQKKVQHHLEQLLALVRYIHHHVHDGES